MTSISNYSQIPSFLIDSNNRLSGSNESFTFKLDIGSNNFDSIVITSVSIPKNYHNINIYNQTFILKEGLVETVIVIPSGWYNCFNFSIVVADLMTNASVDGSTYTITFADPFLEINDGYFTYTCSNTSPRSLIIPGDRVSHLFGFDHNTTNDFTAGVLTSIHAMNFNFTRFISISSDMCHNDGNSDPNITSLSRIPVGDTPDGEVIRWQNADINDGYRQFNNTGSIYHISLYDDHGEPMVTLNNSSFKIQFYLYKRKT